jgi:hypothetical protein
MEKNQTIEKIRNGEWAIYFDKKKDKLSDLKFVLSKIFPKDNPSTNDQYAYYYANKAGDKWVPAQTTKLLIVTVNRCIEIFTDVEKEDAFLKIPKNAIVYVWNESRPDVVICGKFHSYEKGLYYLNETTFHYGYNYCSLENPLLK